MPVQPHSSADAYAQRSDSRPCSSLSMLSGSGEQGDSPRLREINLRRGSVLSFQTALSGGLGGYASTDGSNSSLSGVATGLDASELEHLDNAAPRRPWLMGPVAEAYSKASGSSVPSYSSSHDDALPGGWRSRSALPDAATGEPSLGAGPNSGTGLMGRGRRTPSQSPRPQLSPLVDETERGFSSPLITPSPSAKGFHTPDTYNRSPAHSPVRARSQVPPFTIDLKDQSHNFDEGFLSPHRSQPQLLSPSSGTSTVDGGATIPADSYTHATAGDTLRPRRQETISTITPDVIEAGRSNSPVKERDLSKSPTHVAADPSHSGEQHLSVSPTGRGQSPAPPLVPEKLSPPLPAKDRAEGAPSSPPLSEDIAPTVSDLRSPKDIVSTSAVTSSGSDMRSRSKPSAGLAHQVGQVTPFETQGGRPRHSIISSEKEMPRPPPENEKALPVRAGVGAHNVRSQGAGDMSPAFAVMMRDSSSNVPSPRATAIEAPTPVLPDEAATSPDVETPPREPSPPPEGEVEARAEWERAQMRRLAEQSKVKAATNTSRKTTFRGQLKPLQLVAAEEAKQQARRESTLLLASSVGARLSPELKAVRGTPKDLSTIDTKATVISQERSSPVTQHISPVNGRAASPTVPKGGGESLTTQQLQRMSARDSRLSASAVQMTGGVTEIGGAYPVFASPTLSATRTGARQYSGLMPQRSLVPPFELQNRPDGLPSALTGPDGIRRSPNDPDVCLECMMRDEDMIDVHVLGASLWERESDKAFEEACRVEAEEEKSGKVDGNGQASVNSHRSGVNGALETGSQVASPLGETIGGRSRLTKIRVKRVAKGEPLTAERLKLHTQMNPPASSHRWRTLQAFLAVQAKYIAMDQRARGLSPTPTALPPSKQQASEHDNLMIRTASNDSKRAIASAAQLIKIDERLPLTPQERLQKEKDISLAREARRRNAASAPDPRGGLPSSGVRTPHSTMAMDGLDSSSGVVEDDLQHLQRPASAQMLANENSSGHHSIPRRNNNNNNSINILPSFMRAGTSAQDLRSVPNAMLQKPSPSDLPPSPASALVPPTPPFRSSTPQALGNRGVRLSSSQMSLTHSGSMIDMHVAAEDRRDHRLSQAGFLPGTPLHATSPSAFNRAYYGFPGDGDSGLANESSNTRTGSALDGANYTLQDSTMYSNEQDSGYSNSRDLDTKKQKKKGGTGLRGFFSKIAGKESSADVNSSNQNGAFGNGEGNETAAGDSKMRQRKGSLGAEASYGGKGNGGDLQPPPGMGGLMNRARRSTSSLLNISGRASMDGSTMLNDRLGLPVMNTPGLASQSSFEMGPFGSGPLPPPRTESRAVEPMTGDVENPRARTLSTGTLYSKRKAPDLSDLPAGISAYRAGEPQRSASNGPQLTLNTEVEGSSMRKNDGLQDTLGMRGAARNADIAGQQQHDPVRQNYFAPPSASPISLPVSDFRQSTLVGPPSQYSGPSTSPQMQSMTGVAPTPSDNAQISGSTARPPKRPPRNPHRDTSSQPPSEHTAGESNTGSKPSSPTFNLRPLSEGGPMMGSVFQPTANTNRLQSYVPPMMTTKQNGFSQQRQNASLSGQQMHASFNPSSGGAFQSFPTPVHPSHSRSGSAAEGIAGVGSGYEADESFNSQRSRALSASTPTSSRKSRLLRLPFGRNKRESVAATSVASSKANEKADTPSLRSRSSRGTLDELNYTGYGTMGAPSMSNGGPSPQYASSSAQQPFSRSASSMQSPYTTPSLEPPSPRFYGQADPRSSQPDLTSASSASSASGLKPWLRNRRTSSSFDDRTGNGSGLPPRSQSALGMLDSNDYDGAHLANAQKTTEGKRSLLPKFRTASRSALRSVNED